MNKFHVLKENTTYQYLIHTPKYANPAIKWPKKTRYHAVKQLKPVAVICGHA
jgi:hypothetical protein